MSWVNTLPRRDLPAENPGRYPPAPSSLSFSLWFPAGGGWDSGLGKPNQSGTGYMKSPWCTSRMRVRASCLCKSKSGFPRALVVLYVRARKRKRARVRKCKHACDNAWLRVKTRLRAESEYHLKNHDFITLVRLIWNRSYIDLLSSDAVPLTGVDQTAQNIYDKYLLLFILWNVMNILYILLFILLFILWNVWIFYIFFI